MCLYGVIRMRKSPSPFGSLAAVTLGAAMSVLSSAHAASYNWNPTNTPNTWSLDSNWTGAPPVGGPSGVGDIVTINSNIAANSVVNIFNVGDAGIAAKTLGILNIGDTNNSHAFTVAAGSGNGSLTFDNGGGGAQINQLTTSRGDTISAPISIADGGSLAGSLTISNASTNLFTLSGGISSTGTGAKDLILNSTGTGGLTLSAGVINNNGSITNSGSAGTTTLSSVVGSNVTGIKQNGAGSTLILGGANTDFVGTVEVAAGTLKLGNASALNNANIGLIVSGGVLDLNLSYDATVGSLNDGGSNAGLITNAGNLHQLFVRGSGGTYSGAFSGNVRLVLVLNEGETQVLSGTSAWAETRVNSGALSLENGASLTSAFLIQGNTGATASLTSSIVNAITGNSSLSLGAGNGVSLVTLNAANDFTGAVSLGNNAANVLTLTDTGAIAHASGLTFTAGTIKLLSNVSTTFTTPAISGITSSSTFFVGNNGSGTNQTIAVSGTVNLASNRSLNITGANGYTLALSNVTIGTGAASQAATLNPTTAKVTVGNVSNVATTAGTYILGLGGTSTGNSVTGSITDGIEGVKTAVTVGTVSNASNWTLSGDSTYTGSTTVTNGTLIINGSHAGGAAYTVAALGTFGGAGAVSATSFTTSAGSKLTPGDGGAGTLTMSLSGGMNISASSNNTGAYMFDLGAVGASDKIVLTLGTLNVGVLDFTDFTFNALAGFGAGQYVLFEASSAIAGSIGVATGTINGQSATLAFSGNNVVLNVAAIPEPSTVVMLLVGVLGLGFFARGSIICRE